MADGQEEREEERKRREWEELEGRQNRPDGDNHIPGRRDEFAPERGGS